MEAPDITSGGLYVVAPMDGAGERRVGVVLEVGLGWVEVALVHTEPDITTDEDVAVAPERSPTGYPLVVQFDISGPVFFCQLESYLGRLELQSARTPAEAASALNALPGVAIRSRDDQRRVRKLDELRSLQSLSRSCAGQIIDGPQEDDFDPELLLAARRGSEEALRFLIEAAGRRERATSVVAETLIGEGELLATPDEPRSLELMNALSAFLMPGASPGRRRRFGATLQETVTGAPATSRALSALAASAASSGLSCVFLTTARQFWPGPVRTDTCGTITATVRGMRVQLVGVFRETSAGPKSGVAA